MYRLFVILFVTLLLFINTIMPQDITGNLNGQVIDSVGVPVSDVDIIISGSSLQGTRGASTDKHGYFIIRELPAGLFNLIVSAVGYQTLTFYDVNIQLGKTTTLGIIKLRQSTFQTSEVIVYDKKSVIDPTSTTVGGNLSHKTFNALPTDRNFRSMISLIPQVNTSYLGDEANISGSTGPENIYYIDGANVTELSNASSSTNLPYNFVKEVQVKSGGYEAEYGRALGGILNVITQSGSNEFHGQFFSFFTNNVFGGERRPGLEVAKVPGFTSYDLGFSLGGPIVHDNLWFYVAYNPNVDIQNVELPGFGTYTDTKVTHLFASKLNWQASQKTNFVLSIFGDPYTQQAIRTGAVENGWIIRNKDVLFRELKQNEYNISLHGWHIVNENILIETSASFLNDINETNPGGTFAPYFTDYTANTISGGGGQYDKEVGKRLSISTSISVLTGRHSLKAGLQYEDNSFNSSVINNPSGSSIDKYRDSSYAAYFSFGDGGTVRNQVASSFVQDSWQVWDRFSLNAGFRWDAQFMISSDGKLWQSIRNEYQPRVGIIFQPGQIGTQKIFASYARFYEEVPLTFISHYGAENPVIEIDYNHNPLVDPSGGDTIKYFGTILPEIPDFKGQYFDEILIGYESEVLKNFKLTLKGTYRYLPQVVEDGYDFNTGNFVVGNPGTSNLNFLPKLYRIYKSFEITFENLHNANFYFMVSYVLSRNYGNYSGLFSDGAVQPNTSSLPDIPNQIPNDEGLLPNDRTHVLKFSGSYAFTFGLTVGTFFFWESGTPLTEFGYAPNFPDYFISTRGTAGRTPSIWDLNFRFTYNLSYLFKSSFKPRIKLDLFHLFSQRTPVNYDQVHYMDIGQNGQPTNPNPNYLTPVTFQPPFTARLGLEVEF
jgi:hypothetical protein